MKIEVIFKCGEDIVNGHSEGGRYNGYNNPFGDYIPCVGDYIELGEHTDDFKHLEYTPMKKYVIKSRKFSAIEDYNNSYSSQKCIIELELIY